MSISFTDNRRPWTESRRCVSWSTTRHAHGGPPEFGGVGLRAGGRQRDHQGGVLAARRANPISVPSTWVVLRCAGYRVGPDALHLPAHQSATVDEQRATPRSSDPQPRPVPDIFAYRSRGATAQVIEGCMKKLKDLNKPFKYIGAPERARTLLRMRSHGSPCRLQSRRWSCRKTGRACTQQHHASGTTRAMVHAAPDPRAIAGCSRPARAVLAGSATVRWENKTMYCITTVFGLSI